VVSGALRLTSLARQDDDAIVAGLSAVRGIGPWTAQMFLLFRLGRPDVWPVTDFGVRAGVGIAWGLPSMPSPRELLALGEPFRPYRSLVAWYAWRAVDRERDGLPTSR
jgi:3-methyladenine DNA glycosylase/8-oxoguanine DNA glycosylase